MKASFVLALALVGAAASVATATVPFEYCAGFERPDYTTGALSGQDGWTLPAGSVDYLVTPYGGSVAANPTGGANYALGAATSSAFGRGQHAIPFEDGSFYEVAYDINVLPWTNKPPSVDNIGSFSLQPSASSRFTQSLFTWNDTNNPGLGWDASIIVIDAAGTQLGFGTPSAAWEGLATNHWYRQSFVIDFDTNRLLSATIEDIATNTSATEYFTDVYLDGGANNVEGLAMPTDIRLFAGGGGSPIVAGNTILFDNVCVHQIPAPGAAMLLGVGGLFAARRRR